MSPTQLLCSLYLLVVNNIARVTLEFFLRIQTGSASLHDDIVTFVKLPTSDPEMNETVYETRIHISP